VGRGGEGRKRDKEGIEALTFGLLSPGTGFFAAGALTVVGRGKKLVRLIK